MIVEETYRKDLLNMTSVRVDKWDAHDAAREAAGD